MPDVLGIAVVGAGVMGADHARVLTSQVAGARVVHVADFDVARAAEVAAGCRARSGGDGFAAIADPEVHAVLVASPDRTHRDLVLAAIEAGKPVLCEKPLAASGAECEQIVAAEQAVGRRLVGVGFMRRFDPGYAALRETVAAGSLGAAVMVHNVHRNAVSPNDDTVTQIISTPVHEFDVVAWLLGEPITSVMVVPGRPSSLARPGLHDPLLLLCHSASGVVIDIEVNVNAQYGYDVRCELVLERGTVSLRPPAVVDRRADLSISTTIDTDWRTRFADAYRLELQAWVSGVLGRTPVHPALATARDGLASLRVADACVEAFRTGSTVPVRS